MTCKRSKQCDHADLCRFAQSDDYNFLGGSCFTPKDPQTNEEFMRSTTTDELAGTIYEWFTLGFTRGKNGKKLNPITEVVEWLKEEHNDSM